jgi:hypothetical protein
MRRVDLPCGDGIGLHACVLTNVRGLICPMLFQQYHSHWQIFADAGLSKTEALRDGVIRSCDPGETG